MIGSRRGKIPNTAHRRLPEGERAALCDGKEPFDTPALAAKVAKRMKRRDNDGYDKSVPEPYRCPQCGKWHIGSNKRRQRKIKKLQFRNRGDDE